MLGRLYSRDIFSISPKRTSTSEPMTTKAQTAATATLKTGGANIPLLGFGTYGMSGALLQNVLVAALQKGFRHIDTAQMYQNEADVGGAIRSSGVSRNAVFVPPKAWGGNYS